jgi:hypothetical protein
MRHEPCGDKAANALATGVDGISGEDVRLSRPALDILRIIFDLSQYKELV